MYHRNFKIYENYQTFGTPYDYYSIMHYYEYAFSKNEQKTIVPLKTGVLELVPVYGKNDKQILTATDVLGIKRLYDYDIASTTKFVKNPVT